MENQAQNLRSIGDTFEEIEETPTERIITTKRVIAYQPNESGGMTELLQTIDTVRQPKGKVGPGLHKRMGG